MNVHPEFLGKNVYCNNSLGWVFKMLSVLDKAKGTLKRRITMSFKEFKSL